MTSFKELAHAPRLKIERAKQHIDDLNRVIEAYIASRPLSLSYREDPKLAERAILIKTEKPIPEAAPLIVGDAIHNLRSALDVALFAIVGDKTSNPEMVQFPIARTEIGLEGTITKGQVRFAGPEVVAFIEGLKPTAEARS